MPPMTSLQSSLDGLASALVALTETHYAGGVRHDRFFVGGDPDFESFEEGTDAADLHCEACHAIDRANRVLAVMREGAIPAPGVALAMAAEAPIMVARSTARRVLVAAEHSHDAGFGGDAYAHPSMAGMLQASQNCPVCVAVNSAYRLLGF
jgi:hypothetical protein